MKRNIEELYRKFTEEFGGPNIFSRKATREKYLREAINLGYMACEAEVGDLKKTISQLEEKIVGLEAASKSAWEPVFSLREYRLEQEVKYQKSRVAALLEALTKTIEEYEKNIHKK